MLMLCQLGFQQRTSSTARHTHRGIVVSTAHVPQQPQPGSPAGAPPALPPTPPYASEATRLLRDPKHMPELDARLGEIRN